MRQERGSGSIVTVGLGAALVAMLTLLLPLYTGLATRHAVAASADAAALAAADVASGLLTGFPCQRAEAVARRNATALDDCVIDGLVVTVSVSRSIFGVAARATSTAGPAGSVPD